MHTKTCGCLRATAFWANCNAAVDKLPAGQLALIWEARFAGLSRTATCAKFKLPYGYTDCACKRYQTFLDELAAGDQGRQMVAAYEKQRSSLASVIDTFHLSGSACHYVISAARRRLREQTNYQEGTAQKAESMVRQVESRRQHRELGRPGELTPQELRRANGKLLGSLASFYNECCSAIAAPIPQHERGLIQGFIDLANFTLAQRLERQKAGAKRARRKAEQELNRIWDLV